MKKQVYIAPLSLIVNLNVSGDIAEGEIPVGSKFVDSGDIEGKETDFEEDPGWDSDWYQGGIKDWGFQE